MHVSVKVLKFVGSNKHIASLLYATNSEGCDSIPYAVKSGNIKVFKYLCDKEWLIIIDQGKLGKIVSIPHMKKAMSKYIGIFW